MELSNKEVAKVNHSRRLRRVKMDELSSIEQQLLDDEGIAEALADHCELDDSCIACNTRDAIDSLAPLLEFADPTDVAMALVEDLQSGLNIIAGCQKAITWLSIVAYEMTSLIDFYEFGDHECDHDHPLENGE